MSNAKQTAAVTVALNDQADGPAVQAQAAMGNSAQLASLQATPLSAAAPAGSFQDTGLLLLTALAAVVVLSLRRRQR